MSGYVLSVDADFDLDDIWEYIATDNIDAADRWVEKLFDAFEALGKTPGMGHRREDLTLYPVLFWPVGAYLAVYLKTDLNESSKILGDLKTPWPVGRRDKSVHLAGHRRD